MQRQRSRSSANASRSAGNTPVRQDAADLEIARSDTSSNPDIDSAITETPDFVKPREGALRRWWINNRGMVLVLLSEMFAALMAATTRVLETSRSDGTGLHPFQILFARMGITAVLSSLYMWYTNVPDFPFGLKEVRLLLVSRSAGGFWGVFGLYYSLQYLPLAEAQVITFMAPMLTCFACALLLHQPFSRLEQLAALVSFVGVILIAQPFSSFNGPTDEEPGTGARMLERQDPVSDDAPTHAVSGVAQAAPAQRLAAVAVALVGVLGAAVAYTSIRWIGKRAHPLISVNYYAIVCTVISVLALLLFPSIGFDLPANPKEWALLFFLGASGFFLQFLMTAGLQYDNSSRATNMMYSSMIFALGLDKIIWGSVPNWLSIAGGTLILASTVFVVVRTDSSGAAPTKTERTDEEYGLVQDSGEDDEDSEGHERRLTSEEQDIQLQPVRT